MVVLPEPCRPAIRMMAGGLSIFSGAGSSSPPSVSTSASCTILTTSWPGLIDLMTFSPTALGRTSSMNFLTTESATSASRSATRISRRASLTSFSDRAPRPVRPSNTLPRRSVSASNIAIPFHAGDHLRHGKSSSGAQTPPGPAERNAPGGGPRQPRLPTRKSMGAGSCRSKHRNPMSGGFLRGRGPPYPRLWRRSSKLGTDPPAHIARRPRPQASS